MKYVYLLYTYKEDGPEDLVATLDKSKIVGLAKQIDEANNGWFEKNNELDLLERLKVIINTKGEIPDRYDLMSGWGGLVLEIVELK